LNVRMQCFTTTVYLPGQRLFHRGPGAQLRVLSVGSSFLSCGELIIPPRGKELSLWRQGIPLQISSMPRKRSRPKILHKGVFPLRPGLQELCTKRRSMNPDSPHGHVPNFLDHHSGAPVPPRRDKRDIWSSEKGWGRRSWKKKVYRSLARGEVRP